MAGVLGIDVGGTNIKLRVSGDDEIRKFASGPALTAEAMVAAVLDETADWVYERVSIGYPGPVLGGCPVREPVNLAPGWVGFDFAGGLGRPVKIVNDATMQALGSPSYARLGDNDCAFAGAFRLWDSSAVTATEHGSARRAA